MFDVQQAIKRESTLWRRGQRLAAPPDLDLLLAVGRERPNDSAPFTLATTIKIIGQNRDKLGVAWRESNQRLAELLDEVRSDPLVLRQASRFAEHRVDLPTLAVLQELLRPIFLDGTLSLHANDAGDIHHAVLSVVYCDFVLLDGKWEDLHARMKRRFAELAVEIRTAEVRSARRQGVSRFLDDLESAVKPSRVGDSIMDGRR